MYFERAKWLTDTQFEFMRASEGWACVCVYETTEISIHSSERDAGKRLIKSSEYNLTYFVVVEQSISSAFIHFLHWK